LYLESLKNPGKERHVSPTEKAREVPTIPAPLLPNHKLLLPGKHLWATAMEQDEGGKAFTRIRRSMLWVDHES
jgi:hypothetical protein